MVADEVRSLAQNTQSSISDIADMIVTVQERARASVRSMASGQEQSEKVAEQTREVEQALADVLSAVQNITDMTTQIASAAEQQSATSTEVSERANDIRSHPNRRGWRRNRLRRRRKSFPSWPSGSTPRFPSSGCDFRSIQPRLRLGFSCQLNGNPAIILRPEYC